MIRIALAQQDLLVGDVPGNLEKALACLEQARDAGADLLLFLVPAYGRPREDEARRHAR